MTDEPAPVAGFLLSAINFGNPRLHAATAVPYGLGCMKAGITEERKYGQKLKTGNLPVLEFDQQGRAVGTVQSEFVKTKRGKGGGTWAHLMILPIFRPTSPP